MKKLLFISLLLLSACATPEELAQRQAAQIQQDIATCKSYGLRPGSESFGNCRLQLDLARQRPYSDPYYESPRIRTGIGYYHYR